MKVLGIDTCGQEGSVALAEVTVQGVTVLQERQMAGRTCSSDLMPAIREMLETSGVAVADLDTIVVVRGPGSFTGERVGLGTAKGLAQALGVAVIGVSRLQVLAHKSGCGAAALDAGRGELYFGLAVDEAGEAVRTLVEIREQVDERGIAYCEEKTAELLAGAGMVGAPVTAPVATDALRSAQGRILSRDFDDLAAMDAHYLRRTEAEVVAERRATETAR